MFEKVVVVDGRGHLLGRLASTIAKELLGGYVFATMDHRNGPSIIPVHCPRPDNTL